MTTLLPAAPARPARGPAFLGPLRPLVPLLPAALTTLACVVGCVVGGIVAGLLLAELGVRFGPAAVVAVVVATGLAAVVPRRPETMLAAVGLTLPLGPVPVGPVEVVQLTVAFAVVALLGRAALTHGLRLPAPALAVPLLAMLLSAALATPLARGSDVAFRLDVQLLLLVLLAVAAASALRSRRALVLVTASTVAGGAVAAGWALVSSGPSTTFYGGAVVSGRAQGVFSQPNELGLFSAVLLVVAIGFGTTATSRRQQLLCLVAGGLLAAALAQSLSRGAWIGAVAGLVTLALLSPQARRPIGALAGAALAVVVVLQLAGAGIAEALLARLDSVLNASDNPYDQRGQIWAEALRQLAERPVTGQGPGGFPYAARGLSGEGIVLEIEHAHNLFLAAASEYGVPGLLALLALMAGVVVTAVRATRLLAAGPHPRDAGVPVALAAALVAVVAHGMVDYPLRNAAVVTTVFLVVALLGAWHLHGADVAAPPAPDPARAPDLHLADVPVVAVHPSLVPTPAGRAASAGGGAARPAAERPRAAARSGARLADLAGRVRGSERPDGPGETRTADLAGVVRPLAPRRRTSSDPDLPAPDPGARPEPADARPIGDTGAGEVDLDPAHRTTRTPLPPHQPTRAPRSTEDTR